MPASVRDADVLIVGQGLAGSTLAWALADRGVSVVVVDRGGVDEAGRPSASRVAAGLITPVTGKRLTVAPGFAEQRQTAREHYRRVESATGAAVLTEQPALRAFRDAEEHRRFLERGANGQGVLATLAEISQSGHSLRHMQCGAFVMPGAARLNAAAYCNATAGWLGARLVRDACNLGRELQIGTDRVTIDRLGITARLAVLCVGHSPPPIRWLDGVYFSPAKGEVLTVRSSQLKADRVLHHSGAWIVPEGAGRYRVGATVEWNRLDAHPTVSARQQLLDRLTAAGVTDAEVIDHQAAVRPATPDRTPTFGFSTAAPRVGWLNGLGAKGSLWAPTYAARMAGVIVGSGRL